MKPEEVVDPVVDAAKHPLRTAAWSFGVLRGLAASVIRVASGQRGPVIPGHLPGPVAAPVEEDVKHEDVSRYDLIDAPAPHPAAVVEAAPERAPEPPHESFANEPKAVTRDSAHGRAGADAEIDDWYGETDEEDSEGEGFVLEALAAGDTGDPVATGDLKAILSESETLRRAAELDKG
ncbi:MAG: hypothetical protein ACJ72D_17410 [Marmoricola sp.]